MAKKINGVKVIIVDPDAETITVQRIPNTLEAMQVIVGGDIQYVPINDNEDFIANENGLATIKSDNFTSFCGHLVPGKFFVIGTTPDGGNQDTRMTVAKIKKMVRWADRKTLKATIGNKPAAWSTSADGNVKVHTTWSEIL